MVKFWAVTAEDNEPSLGCVVSDAFVLSVPGNLRPKMNLYSKFETALKK